MTKATCSTEGCDRPHHCRGMCDRHYRLWQRSGGQTRKRTPTTIYERWLPKVRVGAQDECWPWTAVTDTHGYGQLNARCEDGKWRPRPAHRLAWELLIGPIPEGLCVLHRCDNPPCVNVLGGHLFLGTKADNTADMLNKGREWRGLNPVALAESLRTHCPQGHPYAGDNLKVYKGKRQCRECARKWTRAWYHRQKALTQSPLGSGESAPPLPFPP